ncbi:rod shape-determining protein MreD [Methylomicrobium lacus]|uniref:rod shape-determining protein MreD n=1 Tax=Methylomicrobium lacus TaxID=136992 RepID=UPI0035A82552
MLLNSRYAWGRIVITLGLALALRIAPLPGDWGFLNPDWVLLSLIYWSLAVPERVGIFHAWSFGLLTDVLLGRLLGQYALAYSLVIYLCLKLHKRLRLYPLIQQALFIFFCLLLSQLLLFFIKNAQHPAQLHATFWLPVLSGTLAWPLVYTTLRFVRLAKRVK